ncbi:MAG: malate synthase, partial [Candidatus Azotimanducaceae bacterium]
MPEFCRQSWKKVQFRVALRFSNTSSEGDMTDKISNGQLEIEKVLYDLVTDEIIPGTGVEADVFWQGLEDILQEMMPRNKSLLAIRDDFQKKIDDWHKAQASKPHHAKAYEAFLKEIGYLLPEGGDFEIETENVDDEVALMAGPQLV